MPSDKALVRLAQIMGIIILYLSLTGHPTPVQTVLVTSLYLSATYLFFRTLIKTLLIILFA